MISNTTWHGFFGNDQREISGSGNSDVLNIGTGRQCAVVTKTGTGTMQIRVADDSADTGPSHEFTVTRTACGTGPLR